MKRTLGRVLTLAAALPLATAGLLTGPAAASHSTTLPGCWGGVTPGTIVCNLTVTVGVPVGAETYQTSVPVCAGQCYNVPVTLARTTAGEPIAVCYSYTNGAGVFVSNCVDDDDVQPTVDAAEELAQQLVDGVIEFVQTLPDSVIAAVCARLERFGMYCAF